VVVARRRRRGRRSSHPRGAGQRVMPPRPPQRRRQRRRQAPAPCCRLSTPCARDDPCDAHTHEDSQVRTTARIGNTGGSRCPISCARARSPRGVRSPDTSRASSPYLSVEASGMPHRRRAESIVPRRPCAEPRTRRRWCALLDREQDLGRNSCRTRVTVDAMTRRVVPSPAPRPRPSASNPCRSLANHAPEHHEVRTEPSSSATALPVTRTAGAAVGSSTARTSVVCMSVIAITCARANREQVR
jgi:hypothetical protein